ncbi:MAG: hypothetical protein ACI8XB_002600 [Patiriisocius sp.]|jgi:hypothetical protein
MAMRSALIILLLILPLLYNAQGVVLRTDSAKIDFVSEAPLEFISASSNECSGILDKNKNTFAFRVRIRSFEGFNSPLQKEHFNENYLESEDIPYATYVGKFLGPINYQSNETFNVSTKGSIEIHGVADERVINLVFRIEESGAINFSGAFDVELVTHDIDVPRIVYQKISETIQISIKGVLL